MQRYPKTQVHISPVQLPASSPQCITAVSAINSCGLSTSGLFRWLLLTLKWTRRGISCF